MSKIPTVNALQIDVTGHDHDRIKVIREYLDRVLARHPATTGLVKTDLVMIEARNADAVRSVGPYRIHMGKFVTTDNDALTSLRVARLLDSLLRKKIRRYV